MLTLRSNATGPARTCALTGAGQLFLAAGASRRTRTVTLGRFTATLRAGANRIAFSGRDAGRRLARGRYTLRLTAAAGGLTGAPRTATFRVIA